MELSHVEKRRTELLQFILLVIVMVLAVITYLSFRQEQGYLVPALTGICLGACLYVIREERRLKQLQSQLFTELLEKERQVADEKARSSSLETRLKALTDLYRAISAVNSGIDAERTYDTVLRAALQLVGGNCGSVMLLEEGSDELFIASAQGLSDAVVAQTRLKMGRGVAGWVAEHCEPVLLTGAAHQDERFQDVADREIEVNLALSVPLQLRNKVMGVLNLGVTPDQSKTLFTDYDLRVVTIFAQHASVAIENARFMKEMVGSWHSK